MRLQPQIVRQIRPFFPEGMPWDEIDLRIVNMAMVPASLAALPRSHYLGNVKAITRRGLASALKAIGMAIGNRILLDKKHADLSTASGLALLAHEVVHVIQYRTVPNYLEKYEVAAQQTNPNRPWENPWEREAYTLECKVWSSLVAQGVPQGAWKPLGVTLGLC